ncbi:MAG: hypothetical protein MEQ84_07695 [Mesorhizobium sp.]|nr:hypothetical protein [Mesorhizobium sp.]
MAPFPSSVQIIEMNRQAAAEAFSGYSPRMMLALAVSLVVAIAGVMLAIRLHELDRTLAAGLV